MKNNKKAIQKGPMFVVLFCLIIILTAWKSDDSVNTSQLKMESLYNGQTLIQTSKSPSAMNTLSNPCLTDSITLSIADTSKDNTNVSDSNIEGTTPNKGQIEQTADETNSYMDWMINVLPILISITALFISLWHHFTDDRRSKKKDTLDAYNNLQEQVFDELNKIRDSHPVLETYRDTEYRKRVMNCLARIEFFSVGVNNGIYDIKVLKQCGGGYFIRQYYYLEVLIKDKKAPENDLGGGHYEAFQSVTNKLIKMYEKQGVKISPFKIHTKKASENILQNSSGNIADVGKRK